MQSGRISQRANSTSMRGNPRCCFGPAGAQRDPRDCNLNGVTSETGEALVTAVTMDVSAEPADGVDEQLVRQLVDRARAEGLKLTGQGGLLGRLTKVVVESALEGEMDDHLGYGKHDRAGRNGGNLRNESRPKTRVSDAGPVEIGVPPDRESSLEPVFVGMQQRR